MNLLPLLRVLLKYRSMSEAALNLGISQSAASQGLTRLRTMLNDSLLARMGGQMQLTPRAKDLVARVAAVATKSDLSSVRLPRAKQVITKMKWTYETDIVCVGSGAAGLAAAVFANINGDSSIVIEKTSNPGGTTLMSGGVHWIPNNFALRAQGVRDDRDDALAYMARYAHPAEYTPHHPTLGLSQHAFDLLAAFYDNAAAMVDTLLAHNVYNCRQWTFHDRIAAVTPDAPKLTTSSPDYFDHATENKVPTGRVLTPLQHDGSYGFGMHLVEYLLDYLTAHNQTVLLNHRAIELIRDHKGAVIGILADTGSGQVTIAARKAVIFGSGGFAHNPALLEAFHRNRSYHSFAAAGMEGDFIAIASSAGAALANMTGAWLAEVCLEAAVDSSPGDWLLPVFTPVGDSMIYVNKYGKHNVNE